jgi:hypothetical protein
MPVAAPIRATAPNKLQVRGALLTSFTPLAALSSLHFLLLARAPLAYIALHCTALHCNVLLCMQRGAMQVAAVTSPCHPWVPSHPSALPCPALHCSANESRHCSPPLRPLPPLAPFTSFSLPGPLLRAAPGPSSSPSPPVSPHPSSDPSSSLCPSTSFPCTPLLPPPPYFAASSATLDGSNRGCWGQHATGRQGGGREAGRAYRLGQVGFGENTAEHSRISFATSRTDRIAESSRAARRLINLRQRCP